MIDYIDIASPPAIIEYVDADQEQYGPEITEYYPQELTFGADGLGECTWTYIPENCYNSMPFNVYEGYSRFIYTTINGVQYYYGFYDTGHYYNSFTVSGRDLSGNVIYIQILGYGSVTVGLDNSYTYKYEHVYSASEKWNMGYRYYSLGRQDNFSPAFLFFLNEARLTSTDTGLSYSDDPELMPYPEFSSDRGWFDYLYNLGVFCSGVGNKAIEILDFNINGITFLQLFVSGFGVYMGWCIIKWIIPT